MVKRKEGHSQKSNGSWPDDHHRFTRLGYNHIDSMQRTGCWFGEGCMLRGKGTPEGMQKISARHDLFCQPPIAGEAELIIVDAEVSPALPTCRADAAIVESLNCHIVANCETLHSWTKSNYFCCPFM